MLRHLCAAFLIRGLTPYGTEATCLRTDPGPNKQPSYAFLSAVAWLQPELSHRPKSPPVRDLGSVPTGPHILTSRVLFIEVGIGRRPTAIIASHGSIRVV